MEKYTFKIDDKNPLYKKLINLPTAYYRLESSSNGYTIHSQNGTAEIKDIHDVKLKWENNTIVLYEGNLPLKARKHDEHNNLIEKDFTIAQEAITNANRNEIIEKLESKPILISLYNIKGSSHFGAKLSISRHNETGLLNFINFIDFNDESDPVLQMIKKETGGLYFTIEDDNIYISDKEGNCLPVCEDGNCYKYTKNEHDILEISEISTIIKDLTETEQCGTSEAIESSIKTVQGFTLQKGKELSDDIYEAEIMSNGKLIAVLPKIGYHMFNGELVIYNHITKEEVRIPKDFHYLKVIKSSINDDYQLTFCNFLGNEFFEYKRYDPQYSEIPDEYQYISLNYMKKEYEPNFCKLLDHKPSFFITEGTTNSDSLSYCPADVFELTNNGKGRKMATLIDQFGFFNKDDKFRYCDYHIKEGCEFYNPDKIYKEYVVTDENNKFLFNENIVLYTIPELF